MEHVKNACSLKMASHNQNQTFRPSNQTQIKTRNGGFDAIPTAADILEIDFLRTRDIIQRKY